MDDSIGSFCVVPGFAVVVFAEVAEVLVVGELVPAVHEDVVVEWSVLAVGDT